VEKSFVEGIGIVHIFLIEKGRPIVMRDVSFAFVHLATEPFPIIIKFVT
jgi:hypothetical protein